MNATKPKAGHILLEHRTKMCVRKSSISIQIAIDQLKISSELTNNNLVLVTVLFHMILRFFLFIK